MRQKTRSIADLDRSNDVFARDCSSDDLTIRQLQICGAEPSENTWPPLLWQIALFGGKRLVPVLPCPGRLTSQISRRLTFMKEARHGLFIIWRGMSGDRAQPLGE